MAVTATITASHANAQKLSEAETLLGSADDHLRTPFSPSPTHMNSRSLVRPFENFKAHLPEHEVRKVTVPEPTKAQAQHQFPERCTEVEPRAHEKAEECCSMSSYVFISGGATLQRASNLGLKHNHHEPGEQACDAVSKAHTVSGPLQLGTCVCSAAYRKGLDRRETLQNCLCEFPCFRRIWGTCIGNVEVWPGKPFDQPERTWWQATSCEAGEDPLPPRRQDSVHAEHRNARIIWGDLLPANPAKIPEQSLHKSHQLPPRKAARPLISSAAGVRNIQGLLLSHDFSNVPGKSVPCLTRTTGKDNDMRMRALKCLWHFVCIPLREIVLEASSICQQQLSLIWTRELSVGICQHLGLSSSPCTSAAPPRRCSPLKCNMRVYCKPQPSGDGSPKHPQGHLQDTRNL